MNDSELGLKTNVAHDRRVTDDLDWASILIGELNPKTGKMEGGLVPSVAKLAEYMAINRVIDSWILRVIGTIVLLRELGMPRIDTLLSLFAHHTG